MADRPAKPSQRSSLAAQFDAMTLAILVVLLAVAACAALEIGPVEAANRLGCGLNDVVNGLLAYPRPCR